MIRKFILTISLVLLTVLAACSSKPSTDPTEAAAIYYAAIVDSNYEKAYTTLSANTKERYTREDFLTWMTASREETTLKSAKTEILKQYKDFELDGRTYDHVVELSVVESYFDLRLNKDTTNNYKRYLVGEDDEWRIYREGDGKSTVSDVLARISAMYTFGEGKVANANEAIAYAKKSLEYSSDNTYAMYYLAVAYVNADRTDEARKVAEQLITATEDPKEQATAYNIIGVVDESEGKYKDAAASYAKSIELNADDEYAQSNAKRVAKYLEAE